MRTMALNVVTNNWSILEATYITGTMIQVSFEILALSNQTLGENRYFIRYVNNCFIS